MPRGAQMLGSGEPGGTGADDADRLAGRRADLDRIDPALCPGGVGDIFFDAADRYRAVAGKFDHAITFAQSVLGTDAAADLGHGGGSVGKFIGFAQPSIGAQTPPDGAVVLKRTGDPKNRRKDVV